MKNMIVALIIVTGSAVWGQVIKSAETCGECHHRNFVQWQQSSHSGSATDPLYQAVLNTLPPESERRTRCSRCHEPVRHLDIPATLAKDIAKEGVTCDMCHAVNWRESSRHHYVLGPENVKYGPYEDAVPSVHEHEYSQALSSSSACISCHHDVGTESLITCSTESEYKNSSFYKAGVTCQDCHMPKRAGKSAELGKWRQNIYSHVFYGGSTPRMLYDCATLNGELKFRDNNTVLSLSVTNQSVGHALPTGSPLRAVYLKITATSEQDSVLWSNYKTNSLNEDPDALFMRVLSDEQGNAPCIPTQARQSSLITGCSRTKRGSSSMSSPILWWTAFRPHCFIAHSHRLCRISLTLILRIRY
ncbi:MAG: multiheme c-type cytochrome [candidate division KSB1 bacterium]|nr:multiheme c-type cytochrome [candidate division KSB1 bacterium]